MKIKIKQVPDEAPNADGNWITCECNPFRLNDWEYLTTLCDPGYHAVKVEKEAATKDADSKN